MQLYTRPSIVYRERRYTLNGVWQSWFEPCPVLCNKPKWIEVTSKDYPDTPLYPGGAFRLNRMKLISEGKVYHSRHGEYFWLEKPSQGGLFPSKDVISAPHPLFHEMESLGWNWKNGGLTEEQVEICLFAIRHHLSITQAIKMREAGEF